MPTINKAQEQLQEMVKADFLVRTTKNERYSLRAFARDLRVSATTLSDLMAGRRQVSRRTAETIGEHLPIASEVLDPMLGAWQGRDYSEIDGRIEKADLYEDLFAVFSILAFMESQAYDGSLAGIANALDISFDEVERLVDAMTAAKIVARIDDRIVPTGEKYAIGGKGIQPALKAVTEDTLQHVHDFINNASDDCRFRSSDLSTMFIPVGVDRLPAAKKKIQRFRRSLARFLDQGDRDGAYMLAINLVPLANWERG